MRHHIKQFKKQYAKGTYATWRSAFHAYRLLESRAATQLQLAEGLPVSPGHVGTIYQGYAAFVEVLTVDAALALFARRRLTLWHFRELAQLSRRFEISPNESLIILYHAAADEAGPWSRSKLADMLIDMYAGSDTETDLHRRYREQGAGFLSWLTSSPPPVLYGTTPHQNRRILRAARLLKAAIEGK